VRPLVSVVVPAYNAERYIEETLESALRQTYSAMEVIVVDDGSSDRTVDIVQRMDGRPEVLRQENAGVCVARNRGAARARGELLAFLDADDVWESDKIEKQVRIFEEHPDVGLVAVNFDEIDAYGGKLTREIKQPKHLYGRVVDLHRHLLEFGNFLSVSACMTTRAAFEGAGGFYTKQRILSGDYDMWIRISEEHRFYVIPEVLCHYRVLSDSQIHGSLEKEYGAQRRILEMHRGRFSDRGFRRRLARLYRDWADSALFEGKREGWLAWRKAVGLDPVNRDVWLLGARSVARKVFKQPRTAGPADAS